MTLIVPEYLPIGPCTICVLVLPVTRGLSLPCP